MVDATNVPSSAALSDDTKHALEALLTHRTGGQDSPELAAALGEAVKKDVAAQRYGEGEAKAFLLVYNAPYPEDEPEPKKAEPKAHHAEKAKDDDDKKPAPKAKA